MRIRTLQWLRSTEPARFWLVVAVLAPLLGLPLDGAEAGADIDVYAPPLKEDGSSFYTSKQVEMIAGQTVTIHVETYWSIGLSVRTEIEGAGIALLQKLELPNSPRFPKGADEYQLKYRLLQRGRSSITVRYLFRDRDIGGTRLDILIDQSAPDTAR
jgi:hypothetical protein